jgi:hypothetical protein
LLAIICGVEEPAWPIGEVGECRVEQIARRRQPPGRSGGLVQREKAFGQIAVVVGDSHRGSDHAAA